MSDLIDRLENANTEDLHGYAALQLGQLLGEAAEEIDRLRAELLLERLASEHLKLLLREWMGADEAVDGYGIGDDDLIGRTIAAVKGDDK